MQVEFNKKQFMDELAPLRYEWRCIQLEYYKVYHALSAATSSSTNYKS